MQCSWRPAEDIRSPQCWSYRWLGAVPHGCWELNSDLLPEQPVLLNHLASPIALPFFFL